MTAILAAIALAVIAAVWIRQAHPIARPVGYPPRHRGTPHQGATAGWSPAQEQAESSGDDLTPTGLLEVEPPATLDDGTVIGSRGLPSWAALSTDTHHAVDARFALMLAQFGGAIDESAAQFDARMNELVTDFHAGRDDMARVEAEHAELMARLDAEYDGLGAWVGAR